MLRILVLFCLMWQKTALAVRARKAVAAFIDSVPYGQGWWFCLPKVGVYQSNEVDDCLPHLGVAFGLPESVTVLLLYEMDLLKDKGGVSCFNATGWDLLKYENCLDTLVLEWTKSRL